MRRTTSIIFLLLICSLRAAAQQQASLSNPLGGDINAASTNCSVVLSCVWQKLPATATTTTITISGTFVATLPIETSADGGVTFTTSSTQSAATVVTLTTTSLTDVRVRASAYTSGKASVNIQTAGNQISVTVNQGGVTNNTATNPLGVSINVKAAPYNAKGDTQQTNPNVNTIAAATDGCPAGAPGGGCYDIPPGNPLVLQSDIGKTAYASANGNNSLPPLPIAGVFVGTGAHAGWQMITVTGAPFAVGCSSACAFVWGTDDTLALQQAAGAVKTIGASLNCTTANQVAWQPACVRLYFPPGGYMTSGGGTTTPGGPGLPGISTGVGNSVVGSGQNATTFFLRPDYSIGALGGNLGFFLQNPCDIVSDFQVTSSQFTFNFPSNPPILSNCSSTTLARVRVGATGNAGSSGLVSVGGAHSIVKDLMVQDPAALNATALCDFNGGTVDVYNLFCSNNTSTTTPNLQIRNYTGGTSGNRITFHGGEIDECGVTGTNACTTVVAAKDVSFYGTTLLGGANTSLALNVDATSEVRCVGCTLAPFGGNASSDVTVAAGGQFRATLTKFIAFGGTRWIWNCGDANACLDAGENIYTLLSGASLYSGAFRPVFVLASEATSQLGGQQVVNGAVPTACTVTGNGTSTCAFDTGSTDAAGHITITAAGATTAVGLVSFNFSRTYGTNSTTCSANYQSGTGAWAIGAVAPIFITSTTAAASFNINNAGTNLAAASTYKVNYTCYGQ